MSPITLATSEDAPRCAAVLTLAFTADPPTRWIWPESACFLQAFPQFVQAFGGRAFAAGTALRTGCWGGAALWLPPGESPDETALGRLFESTVPRARQPEISDLFDHMAAYHPTVPHWHLPIMGVDPASQKGGLGSALLARMLSDCDRDGLPAYLEATCPTNVRLYRRHGFEPMGEIRVGTCPTVTPMLRPARPTSH